MQLLMEMLRSAGWLFGVPMLLSALAALVLCAWATWIRTDRARRAALIAALTPLVLGCIGVPWATVLLWRAPRAAWIFRATGYIWCPSPCSR